MATVLITGANKGIGVHLTRLYAEAGNKVIACCRNTNDADNLKALGGDIKIKQVVVGNDASVAELGSGLSGVPIDILVNKAGAVGPAMDKQTLATIDSAGWLEAFNVSSIGPVSVTQALLKKPVCC